MVRGEGRPSPGHNCEGYETVIRGGWRVALNAIWSTKEI